ncbi:uncharacterized protein LOC143620155 [Bidens hawaiensis]|uniref:uncharacterized protein LOC143620155 n=1 Tax=Bidens hawaiensis TaxID=980011 RepID=UPI00404ACD31
MLEIGVYKATTYHASGSRHFAQIGEGFVAQYYLSLCIYPRDTCKFYNEERVMTRTKVNGTCSITTIKEIKNELLDSEMRNAAVILLTVHSQKTIAKSILVGVTGLLSKDGKSKCFHQSFLLARQARAFFVKNDFLRFTDMSNTPCIGIYSVCLVLSISFNFMSAYVGFIYFSWSHLLFCLAEYNEVLMKGKHSGVNQTSASIVPVANGLSTATRIAKTILVMDLPPNVTHKSIARAVKEFGPVKYKNIHIRGYDDDYTYAFVEFNKLGAANLAVQVGSIEVDGRECLVEHKESRIEDL